MPSHHPSWAAVMGTSQRHMCCILIKRTRGVPPPASGSISRQISAVYVIVVEFHTLTCKGSEG